MDKTERTVMEFTENELKILKSVLESPENDPDDLLAQVSADEITGLTDRQYRASWKSILTKFGFETN